MSRLKASFSLIIMLLLVGMFSAVAFAAEGPENLTVKQNSDNTLTLNWAQVKGPANRLYTNVKYNVTIKQDGTQVDSATDLTTTSYTTIALDPGKKYTLDLVFTAKDYKGNDVTGTSEIDYSLVDYNSTLATGDDSDNNLPNANHTGASVNVNDGSKATNVIKARDTHKVHGSYQNNTNSCASCHQTHTGNDTMLLFKNGTYDTCTACHDGTLGFYNVFEKSNAGTFGGSHAGNMSVHLANGAVAVKAAPGGNSGATTGSWTGEFTCASCHAPHGSDSIRLLSTNPAGVASKVGLVKASVPATVTDTYVWVKQTVATDGDTNYPGTAANTPVIQLYKAEGGVYKPYYQLTTKDTVSTGTWFVDGAAKVIRAGADFAYYTSTTNVFGYVPTGGVLANAYNKIAVDSQGTFTVPIIVTGRLLPQTASNGLTYTTVDNRAYFDSTYAGKYVSNSGKSMSAFCTACHADYLSDTHSNESGVYTQAYRHQTNTDKLTCVRCHFAHGTDAPIMKDSLDRGIPELTATGAPFDPALPVYNNDVNAAKAAAEAYLKDPNPSSALKRYTGMGVCFGCHDTSIGNDATTISNSSSAQPGTNITQ